jgi:hypothetical protein
MGLRISPKANKMVVRVSENQEMILTKMELNTVTVAQMKP